MRQTLYVGLDVHKKTIVPALAEEGRRGEVRSLTSFENSRNALKKMLGKLSATGQKLHFCYEAGACGYGVYRDIVAAGHQCYVVAPSKIARRPGDRVKTDRRDAEMLAKALRAGEVESVWVPDPAHEAIRDLMGCRTAAMTRMKKARQQLQAFLLRHSRHFEGKAWTKAHWRWLAVQKFDLRVHQVIFDEYCNAVRDAEEHHTRIIAHIDDHIPQWSLAPVVRALCSLRGISTLSAATLLAATGDLRRFPTAIQLMGYFGLVPSEHSSGAHVRRGSITKAGNSEVRRMLIQAGWCYRHPSKIGITKYEAYNAAEKNVRDIAWKAQTRLHKRFQLMLNNKKSSNIIVTAIARELLGFVWAIGQVVHPS